MKATIQRWGNSQGIRLPKVLLDDVNWSETEHITILVDGDKLIIEKEEKYKKNIKELFEGYDGNYEPTEIDWGKREGEEIW